MSISERKIVNNGTDKDLCRNFFQTWSFHFFITLSNKLASLY